MDPCEFAVKLPPGIRTSYYFSLKFGSDLLCWLWIRDEKVGWPSVLGRWLYREF